MITCHALFFLYRYVPFTYTCIHTSHTHARIHTLRPYVIKGITPHNKNVEFKLHCWFLKYSYIDLSTSFYSFSTYKKNCFWPLMWWRCGTKAINFDYIYSFWFDWCYIWQGNVPRLRVLDKRINCFMPFMWRRCGTKSLNFGDICFLVSLMLYLIGKFSSSLSGRQG